MALTAGRVHRTQGQNRGQTICPAGQIRSCRSA
jgi:hypothetical protein